LNFDINKDPDLTFLSNADPVPDPDPTSKNNPLVVKMLKGYVSFLNDNRFVQVNE
jgi:hypothetical protein